MDSQIPTVVLDRDLCKGCGLCIDVCKPNVLYISDQFNVLGYQSAQYKGSGCTGCEACFYTCPEPGVFTVIKLEDDEKPARSEKVVMS